MRDILINEITTTDFLTKSKLPDSDYVINPYVGCTHGCKYCYARFMKRFTKHDEEWGEFIDVKRCSKKISAKKLTGKTVFLSSVTDCYNEVEECYQVTRNILNELKDIDCTLVIATKSKLILRDLDLLKQCKDLKVAISLNTMDEKFRKDMDMASTVKERINTLKTLHDNDIYTVLFMSPIFPYITDYKEIIENTYIYVSEYWFENLNLRGSYKTYIINYIKEKYPEYLDEYINIYMNKNDKYFKDLSREIEEYCKLKNIKYINYFYHGEREE